MVIKYNKAKEKQIHRNTKVQTEGKNTREDIKCKCKQRPTHSPIQEPHKNKKVGKDLYCKVK